MDGYPVKIVEAVCLGASVALSSMCFYMYRKSRKEVEKLDDAPRFSINGNLKNLLNVSPGKCLQYAVIEGTVQATAEPLTSQFQKDTVGVLQRFMLREHRLLWNGISHTWMDSERVLFLRENAVPFVLMGVDETSIKVIHPLQASGVHMEITYERFHQSNYGLGDILGQYLSGEKLKGQLETEEMLKVGTTLTGIGKLVLDRDGAINLEPPSNGSQYFLSITDFDTLRESQASAAGRWKTLAVVSAVAGAVLLLWLAQRYYCHLKAKREREQARRDFQSRLTEAARVPGASETEEEIENACLICLSQPRNCILLDCGHVCICFRCSEALTQRRCPICMQNISRVLPIYNA
ncbi:mitochondrial ubiquitin ligase activator of nfkb 1-A [Neosynchiropus ocellatus]